MTYKDVIIDAKPQPSLPLNEFDQDNLNAFFDQSGLANKLDKDPSALLRLDQMGLILGPDLNNEAVYNQLLVQANESLNSFAANLDSLKKLDVYASICGELKYASDRSRSTLSEYIERNKGTENVQILLRELESFSKTNEFQQALVGVKQTYLDLKDIMFSVGEHTASVLAELPTEHKGKVIENYTNLSNEVLGKVGSITADVYLTKTESEFPQDIQSDFNKFTMLNALTVSNANNKQGYALEQEVSHSPDNSI